MPAPRAHQLAPTSHRGFTACRSTRRGRPRRRCWRARRPPRAAHRCLLYGVRERRHLAPTIQLRRFSHEDSRRGARAMPRPRGARTRVRVAHARHGHAGSALAFGTLCELPALAVRRVLRLHDCADSVASDGSGGGAGEVEQDEQAGTGCAVAAATSRERAWSRRQVCSRGGSAD